MADAPQADVERLYGLDLDEFIPARDATARRLRSDGRREQADHVKALRKPSNPAWIVNRLARARSQIDGRRETVLDPAAASRLTCRRFGR